MSIPADLLAPCGRQHQPGAECRHCLDLAANGRAPARANDVDRLPSGMPRVHAHCPLCPFCGVEGPELHAHRCDPDGGNVLEFHCCAVRCLAYFELRILSNPFDLPDLPLESPR